jgi:hypothetical protein
MDGRQSPQEATFRQVATKSLRQRRCDEAVRDPGAVVPGADDGPGIVMPCGMTIVEFGKSMSVKLPSFGSKMKPVKSESRAGANSNGVLALLVEGEEAGRDPIGAGGPDQGAFLVEAGHGRVALPGTSGIGVNTPLPGS